MADRNHRRGRWVLRAFVATLLVGALPRVAADPLRSSTPARAVPASADRIVATLDRPLRVGGLPAGAVQSVIRVPGRMRYGQALWSEAGVPPGRIWIRVDRQAQILSVFRGPHEIGTAVILYGAPQKPTPPGRYPVLGKAAFHISRAYNAEMPYTLWLTRDGIGIHAGNVRQGAATHGCVGVPKAFARRLFDLVKVGDPVLIV